MTHVVLITSLMVLDTVFWGLAIWSYLDKRKGKNERLERQRDQEQRPVRGTTDDDATRQQALVVTPGL